MSESTRLKSRLNKRQWIWKMYVFLVALVGLGIWGALDAWWIYPARGERHTEFALKNYLESVSKNGSLLQASVEDPAAEFARLNQSPVVAETIDGAKKEWLLSVSRLHNLESITKQNEAELAARRADPARAPQGTRTMFVNAGDTLSTLTQQLSGQNQPKPLTGYDLPLQYFFVLMGFGGALYLVFFLAKCSRTVFEYDPAEKRLFLPNGKSFTPADIAEVDKRDWHKFFIHLKLRDGSPEFKLDLLRYEPLEEWVEEMRKLRPGYDPAEDEKPADEVEVKEGAGEAEEEADKPQA